MSQAPLVLHWLQALREALAATEAHKAQVGGWQGCLMQG